MAQNLFRAVAGKPFDWSNPAKFVSCERLTEKAVCFINGQWVQGVEGDNAPVIAVDDPCTNKHIGDVPKFGRAQTEFAIAAAQEAYESWKERPPRQRAQLLRKWADVMLENKVALGNILSRESGKVITEGVGEILYAQSFLDWFSGEAERVYGDIIPGPRAGVQTTVLKQPIGVVGIITPWNFPTAMIMRATAAAVAAGCAVVIKPASATPFSALALAQAAQEAGIPDGIVNVVTGSAGEISEALLSSFDVRKIAFTGSTEVGQQLFRGCADTVKKVGMELGGNAPLIVFDDAEIDRAVDGLIAAKWRNAGQTCICCNRAFVQARVYDEFKDKLVAKVKQMKMGNAFTEGVTIGSLINHAAVVNVASMVEDAVAKGATVECGGTRPEGEGCFFPPTVLTHVDHATMRCCQEEIFGPILPLLKFETEEDAVRLANSTRAGLASYFYTQDYRRQHRVARALRFGMVGCNDTALSAACAPFGGIKESGVGRDGSKYGIEPFVDVKYVLFSTV